MADEPCLTNRKKKRDRTAASWQRFVKLLGRKTQGGVEPNDRKHSVRMERKLRRMRPEDFDQWIRDGEGESCKD